MSEERPPFALRWLLFLLECGLEKRDQLAARNVLAAPGLAKLPHPVRQVRAVVEVAKPRFEVAACEVDADIRCLGVFQVLDQRHRVVGSQGEPAGRSRGRGTILRGAENAVFHYSTRFISRLRFISVDAVGLDKPNWSALSVANMYRMDHPAPALRGTRVTLASISPPGGLAELNCGAQS